MLGELLRNRFQKSTPLEEPDRTALLRRLEAVPPLPEKQGGVSMATKMQERRDAERNIEVATQRCLLLFSNYLNTIIGIHDYLPLLDRTLVGQKATPEVATRVSGQIANALGDFYKANSGGRTRTGLNEVIIPESRTGFTLIPTIMAEARLVDTIGKMNAHMPQWCAEWIARSQKTQ